jgi:hypothetical protein
VDSFTSSAKVFSEIIEQLAKRRIVSSVACRAAASRQSEALRAGCCVVGPILFIKNDRIDDNWVHSQRGL